MFLLYNIFNYYDLKTIQFALAFAKHIQSNLSTTATLGTPKKWPWYRVGLSLQVFQSKLVLKVAWPDLGWPLLTGGRYSEVAVSSGLTVYIY